LESLETSFHQDLNGDGVIGIPAVAIETFGSTSLVEVGSNYFLNSTAGGTGPDLRYAGAAVVAGQLSPWSPIGAEQISGGYEVAWKSGAQYTVWDTDGSGNYVSNTGVLSGNSATLESLETSFHQDLNGDGVIGIPTAQTITTVQSGQLSSPQPVVVASNDTFLFRGVEPDLFVAAAGTDTIAPDEPVGNRLLVPTLQETQIQQWHLLESINYHDTMSHSGGDNVSIFHLNAGSFFVQ
jgi:hypothetical protein